MNYLRTLRLVVTNSALFVKSYLSSFVFSSSYADNRTEMIRAFTAYLLPGFMYAAFKDI